MQFLLTIYYVTGTVLVSRKSTEQKWTLSYPQVKQKGEEGLLFFPSTAI